MRDILQLRPDYETAGLEFRSRFSASGLSLKPIQKEAVLEKKQQPYKKHMARMRDHHSTEIMFVTLALPAQFKLLYSFFKCIPPLAANILENISSPYFIFCNVVGTVSRVLDPSCEQAVKRAS